MNDYEPLDPQTDIPILANLTMTEVGTHGPTVAKRSKVRYAVSV